MRRLKREGYKHIFREVELVKGTFVDIVGDTTRKTVDGRTYRCAVECQTVFQAGWVRRRLALLKQGADKVVFCIPSDVRAEWVGGEIEIWRARNVVRGGRHSLMLSADVEKSVEAWRSRQRPIPGINDTVNRLLRKALSRTDEK